MATTNHPATRQPTNNENLRLWKYMDFTKYVDLLESKALFLARVDKFEDNYEGAYPKENLKQQSVEREHLFKQYFNDVPGFFGQLSIDENKRSECFKQHAYISCWHSNDYESAAMWKLYGETNNSVAIETDYLTLDVLTPQTVYLGLYLISITKSNHFPKKINIIVIFIKENLLNMKKKYVCFLKEFL